VNSEAVNFPDRKAWANWLDRHHNTSSGIWVRLAKKRADFKSVTYPEALEEALCYGWIDALKRGESETAWLQRFTPRGPKSIWSKINRQKALELIEAGRMKPSGLIQVERAQADGRWDRAYDGAKNAEVPPDLEVALLANLQARRFFETLDRANRYAVLFRIHTAKKPETRARRVEKFVAMLEKGERIHPV
jgi:uncharacterized protein YdeI (YjbR/CyaY-like superfamily)